MDHITERVGRGLALLACSLPLLLFLIIGVIGLLIPPVEEREMASFGDPIRAAPLDIGIRIAFYGGPLVLGGALTAAYLRAKRTRVRVWSAAIALLLPTLLLGSLGIGAGSMVGVLVGMPRDVLDLLRAVATGATHSGEWWRETFMGCLFGTLALWLCSWSAVSLAGLLRWVLRALQSPTAQHGTGG